MIEFLQNNVGLVLEILVLLFSLINILKKKVKITDSVFTEILVDLPSFIIQAESMCDEGKDKFSIVYGACISKLVQLTGKNQAEIINIYGLRLKACIEQVLATPQKKGVKDEK